MGGGHRLPLCRYQRLAWVTVFRTRRKLVIVPHGDLFKKTDGEYHKL
jgi:hypothetical protein